tara:strand:- start:240 stop:650 length:411 start_codon:yes stop_codon:yes gene_type:complete
MIDKWKAILGLKGWTITTEAIDKKSVIYEDDVPDSDKYFVGIQIYKESMRARIYHDRPLTDEYVIHELLHVKYPDWSEDQVNSQTTLYKILLNPDYAESMGIKVHVRVEDNGDKYAVLNNGDEEMELKINQNKDDE